LIFAGGSPATGLGYLKWGCGTSANCFGPEVTFGRKLADHLKQPTLGLIKIAWGGTNLCK